MFVVADVVLAIAVVAVALGAVPELQFRVGYIRPAADTAAVGVQVLGLGGSRLIAAGAGEGDNLGLLWLFAEQPPGVHSPGEGNDIGNILAEE